MFVAYPSARSAAGPCSEEKSPVQTRERNVFPLSAALASERGFSLIELFVALGIFGLLVAVALPNLDHTEAQLEPAVENLAASIRTAHAHTLSRGARYRVTLGSTSYSVRRLQDNDGDGVWVPDSTVPTQTITLPSGTTISQGAGTNIEFTTRGLLAPQANGAWTVITIALSSTGHSKSLEVWPSGQVER